MNASIWTEAISNRAFFHTLNSILHLAYSLCILSVCEIYVGAFLLRVYLFTVIVTIKLKYAADANFDAPVVFADDERQVTLEMHSK